LSSFGHSSPSKSTKDHNAAGVVDKVTQEVKDDNAGSFWVPGYVAEALGKGGTKSASNDEPVDEVAPFSSQKPSILHGARSKAMKVNSGRSKAAKTSPKNLNGETPKDESNSLHDVPSMGSASDIRHSEGLTQVEMTPIFTDAAESQSGTPGLQQSFHVAAGLGIFALSLSDLVWR